MSLSIDSIFKPLNDYFIQRFQTQPGDTVFFRLSKYAVTVDDEDFMMPGQPQLGYSPPVAQEFVSNLVNQIPDSDDITQSVLFLQDSIDQTYFYRALNASQFFVPVGSDDASVQSVMDTFNRIRQDAVKAWEQMDLVSTSGIEGIKVLPVTAAPTNWYDKTNRDIWTSESFQVSDPTPLPSDSPQNPRYQILKYKIDDNKLQRLLSVEESQPIAPIQLYQKVRALQPIAAPVTKAGGVNLVSRTAAKPVMAFAVKRNLDVSDKVLAGPAETLVNASVRTAPSFAIQNAYIAQAKQLDVKKRIAVSQYLESNAPSKPANTDSVKITFDFCVVNVRRPWWFSPFISSNSWFVPQLEKGQLSSRGMGGASLSAIPVGFVAVKNLNISGTWSAEDLGGLDDVTQFGPFGVTKVNNNFSHEGIQVMGWMLQALPALPPNSPRS